MKCKRFEEKIIDMAFGELAEAEADAVQRHIDGCERCAELAVAYRTTAVMAQAPQEIPSPSLSSERLRQAILSRELKTSAPRARLAWAGGLAAFAVGAFALVNSLQLQGTANSDDTHLAVRTEERQVQPRLDARNEDSSSVDPADVEAAVRPAPSNGPPLVASEPPIRIPPAPGPSSDNAVGEANFPGPSRDEITIATTAPPPVADDMDEVVVIHASNGSATEVSSDDVAFGG